MKKRSRSEKLLIGLLAFLLLVAIVCFTFLLRQYLSPADPLTSTSTSSELSVTAIDPTSLARKTIEQVPTSSGDESNTRTPDPDSDILPTQYTYDLLQENTGSLPSHFLFARPLDQTTPIWPVLELRFGSDSNFSSHDGIHTGLDLVADIGTHIHALASGEVIWCGYGIESNLGPDNAYGIAVTIKHDAMLYDMSIYSIYAHLSVTHVEEGDRVNAGDLIAEVGLSGNTSGPHLHLEVRLGDDSYFVTRNPELFIPPLENHGVLAAHLYNTDGSNLYAQEVIVESLADHQRWSAESYASGAAVPDLLLNENLVIGDLPAGQYAIIIYYGSAELHHSVIINPGEITYFTFHGNAGYRDGLSQD
ncbi:MAG: M23 family metallopeptidase [Anaerolineaceae bacterium]|nr:M23 family metallopeptidase [Anaerolineaceae bacterium]MBN2678204.1 M23 family metallopeptidase [Anaerolineaceae bacterium]